VATPKPAGEVMFRVGFVCSTKLVRLNASAESFILTRSNNCIVLPMDISRFQNGKPRTTPRELCWSALTRMGRKLLKTADGFSKRFTPVPPLAGLPVVATPPEPDTPRFLPDW
jgi:hypothetical protein